MAKQASNIKARAAENTSPPPASPWSPLRQSVFRALWIASVVSNIGSWMQDVGESWLMTSLTLSPLLVALVETAGSLPVVLAALPAGALADIGRSPPLVVDDASLDGHCRGGNGCSGFDGLDDSRTFALADFYARHRFGSKQSSLASDRA
jgi:hypothetical protein